MYSDALARVATRCAAAAVSSVIDLCRLHRISLGALCAPEWKSATAENLHNFKAVPRQASCNDGIVVIDHARWV